MKRFIEDEDRTRVTLLPECLDDFELMWLTGRLGPDFKTTDSFRTDDGAAIRKVCRQFVALCQQLKALEVRMRASPDQPRSLTDPDARPMKSRDGGLVGYNVQAAVDANNHRIVAHEVITEGFDRDHLAPVAEGARAATGIDALTVMADRGYFRGEQIRQCVQAGITPLVPKSPTSNSSSTLTDPAKCRATPALTTACSCDLRIVANCAWWPNPAG